MATQPIAVEDVEANVQAGQVKLPILTLLAAIAVAVIISVSALAGLGVYLVKTGKLPLVVTAGTVASSPKTQTAADELTHTLVLEPMVVNLADDGGKAYLRVGLTLRIADVESKKDAKSKGEKGEDPGVKDDQVAARDTVLDVLGRQTAEELLDPDGKERLKNELKSALVKRNPTLTVREIFFGEFLVQR